MGLLLLIIIVALCFGGLPPISGHWHSYGWGPSGFLFVVVIVLVVMLLMGRL
jgi:Protein of unknown function (DUF3309)